MHKIAAMRGCFGYRSVGIKLERKDLVINEKKLYRIYRVGAPQTWPETDRGSRTPMPMP